MAEIKKIGDLLREWRGRRKISQLDLAYDTEISPKHLSFIETGRAQPSREMILKLAEQLEIPLRARNVLLTSAGYAPTFPEKRLDDTSLEAAKKIVDLILEGHSPNPALALDRHWNMLSANKSVSFLLAGVDQSLLAPPVNVLRLSLHPRGLAPQIINYEEWREHLLERLRRQIEITADAKLLDLLRELRTLPKPPARNRKIERHHEKSEIAVALRLETAFGELSFISTTTVFGTPVEITLAEMIIESFFPANDSTARKLSEIAASSPVTA